MPTLEEVFSLINGKITIHIHLVWAEGLKEEPARKLVDIIHKYNAAGWVIIFSVLKDLENVNKFAAQKGMSLVLGTAESPDQEGLEQVIAKAHN